MPSTEDFPVETADKLRRIFEPQLVCDILTDPPGSRRRKSGDRHIRELVPQIFDLPVLGPELMSPHRDTVRFVHGKKCDLAAGKRRKKCRGHGPLRRNIQDPDLSFPHLPLDPLPFIVGLQTVESLNRDPLIRKSVHLILHQRDQGRDNDRHPFKHHCRKLITKGFSPAGRHHREYIPPADDRLDDLLLIGTKRLMMEVSFKCLLYRFRHEILCQCHSSPVFWC